MTISLRHREARSAAAIQNETSAVLDCFANARNDDVGRRHREARSAAAIQSSSGITGLLR
jgi:hypothetical protein